jgi:hypothetical protein
MITISWHHPVIEKRIYISTIVQAWRWLEKENPFMTCGIPVCKDIDAIISANCLK